MEIGGIKMAGLEIQAGLRWRDRDSFFGGIIFFFGIVDATCPKSS